MNCMVSDNTAYFNILTTLLAPNDPAEIHGLLCGLLCVHSLDVATCLETVRTELQEAHSLSTDAEYALRELVHGTNRQLQNADLVFMPLLPDDEAPLSQRLMALGEWSQGFLAGLGLAGAEAKQLSPADIKDFLTDVAQIARISIETDASQEDETAYMELVEYLRMGVLMIYQERRDRQDGHTLEQCD